MKYKQIHYLHYKKFKNSQKIMKEGRQNNKLSPKCWFFFTYVLALQIGSCQQQTQPVYGVRWSLADRFIYHTPSTQENTKRQNYYILSFNSDQLFEADVLVKVKESTYTCSGRKIYVDMSDYQNGLNEEDSQSDKIDNETETCIYKCFVNQDLYNFPQRDVNYTIFTSKPIFMKDINPNYNNGTHTIIDREVKQQVIKLFKSKFRAPPTESQPSYSNNIQFFAIGDWGVGKTVGQDSPKQTYYEVVPSMVQLLERDKDICLTIFLGDIAYDFVGDKYFAMLKKIQPLSSRIAFMATPGNHDYLYHEQSFQLFSETFLSPEWNEEYSFYYNFIVGRVLFIQYTPENLVYKEKYQVNNSPLEQMREDFTDFDIQYIEEQYHVIVFNHYPVYCSNLDGDSTESCVKNEERLSQYLNLFSSMGMDMYLAGHIHNYERFNEVCPSGQVIKPQRSEGKADVYSSECPIYIIQGAGGFSFAMFQQYNKSQNSSKIVYGPGYGLIQVDQKNGENHRIFYRHYLAKEDTTAQVADSWIRFLIPTKDERPALNNKTIREIEIIVIIFLLLLIGGICYWHRYGLRKKESQNGSKKSQHIQMIEEQFQTVALSDRGDEAHKQVDKENESEN